MHPSPAVLINVDVDDIEAAIRFYQEAIGLRLQRRLFDGAVAEMSGASSPIYLLEKATGFSPIPGTDQIRSYVRHWTPVHLDFVVPEINAAVGRAVHAGARMEADIQAFAWGRQALMSDPFGNGFCFVEWTGDGYEEVS